MTKPLSKFHLSEKWKNHITSWVLSGGLLLSLSLVSITQVQAQVTCQPLNSSIPRTDIITLAPVNISASADMPDGTVIYRGSWFDAAGGFHLNCRTPSPPEMFNYAYNLGIVTAPMPLSNWSGSPYGGKVYQTGIPGIGVAITNGNNAATLDIPFTDGNLTKNMLSAQVYMGTMMNTRYINLIKIGPISPGNYPLSAVNLPTAKLYYDNVNGAPAVIGFPIVTNILQFQGTLNISTQTCSTPDVVVPLGTFDISKTFNGVGSTTPWVKTNLALQNCPTFYGYYSNNNIAALFDYSKGGASNIPASTSNNVGIRLTPNTSIVNATNGVMAIDTSSSNAASGVGIQIGWGDVTPIPFDLNNEQQMLLPKDGTKNISIPLSARYIQTSSTVTAGQANGKLTFTINYY
nr:fimbrial protein [Serratia proteamaculans]